MTNDDLASQLRRLVDGGALSWPNPGSGSSAVRLHGLAAIAAADLDLARLVEAHVDATSILHEAGRAAKQGSTYGVWASESSDARLVLTREGGRCTLVGRKGFCSGAALVDRALVTAHGPDGLVLIDVELGQAGISVDATSWKATALGRTGTATVAFESVEVSEDQIVGPPGWYLARPGFWMGACSPAACWAGGAMGLVDRVLQTAGQRDLDAHALAAVGHLDADRWALAAACEHAGRSLDEHAGDGADLRSVAERFRLVVERSVGEVVLRSERLLGPRPLAFDHEIIGHLDGLRLYVRQHHGDADAAALGAAVVARDAAPPR